MFSFSETGRSTKAKEPVCLTIYPTGERDVMITVIGNKLDEPSSNLRDRCLCFTSH